MTAQVAVDRSCPHFPNGIGRGGVVEGVSMEVPMVCMPNESTPRGAGTALGTGNTR